MKWKRRWGTKGTRITVNELIVMLESCNPDAEVCFVSFSYRPFRNTQFAIKDERDMIAIVGDKDGIYCEHT